MRFALLALLPLLAAAIPVPDNASSTKANALANGINANLDAGNQEIASVQKVQSDEKNNAPASQTNADIGGITKALDTAVGDREHNQELAARSSAEEAGLAKVQTAQGKAASTISTLDGSSKDSGTLNTLLGTFEKGFATNENNLAIAQEDNN